jgi:hypothetical protein
VPLGREVSLSDEPAVDEARRLFTRLAAALPSTFADRDVSDIIAKAIRLALSLPECDYPADGATEASLLRLRGTSFQE